MDRERGGPYPPLAGLLGGGGSWRRARRHAALCRRPAPGRADADGADPRPCRTAQVVRDCRARGAGAAARWRARASGLTSVRLPPWASASRNAETAPTIALISLAAALFAGAGGSAR